MRVMNKWTRRCRALTSSRHNNLLSTVSAFVLSVPSGFFEGSRRRYRWQVFVSPSFSFYYAFQSGPTIT